MELAPKVGAVASKVFAEALETFGSEIMVVPGEVCLIWLPLAMYENAWISESVVSAPVKEPRDRNM